MTKSPRLAGDNIEPVVFISGPRSPHRTNRNDLVPTWREFVQFLLRSPVEEDVTWQIYHDKGELSQLDQLFQEISKQQAMAEILKIS